MTWYTLERAIIIRTSIQDLSGLRELPVFIQFATGRSIGTAIVYGEYIPAPIPKGGTSQLVMPLENGSIITLTECNGKRRVKYMEKINGELHENFAGIYIGNARRALCEPNGQGKFVEDPGCTNRAPLGQLS